MSLCKPPVDYTVSRMNLNLNMDILPCSARSRDPLKSDFVRLARVFIKFKFFPFGAWEFDSVLCMLACSETLKLVNPQTR